MYKLNKDNITADFESLTNFRYSSNVFVFKHHLNALSFVQVWQTEFTT